MLRDQTEVTVISAPLATELSTAWHTVTEQRRVVLLAMLTVCLSLLFVGLVLIVHIVSVALLLACAVVVAVAWRPRLGLYALFGLSFVFEAEEFILDPLMLPGRYLHGTLQSTARISGAIVSPFELLLLLTLVMWLGQGIARRRLDFRGGWLLGPIVLFATAMVFGLVRGAVGGGNMNIALWEARYLAYVIIGYFLAANTIRDRRHLATLTALVLIGGGLFAL